MGKYLGIDSSTQSITGLLIDTETGTITAEESINFDAHFKDAYGVENGVFELGAGAVHSAPLMWVEALDLLLQTLVDQGRDLGQVQAIAGSGQQHGTVYLNGSAAAALENLIAKKTLKDQLADIFSRNTAPIWMDTSTLAQCGEIEAGVGGRDQLLTLTGNTAFERFSGPQIRKFFQTEPSAYADTAHIGLVSSYVASLLAGKLVGVDPGDGSGTSMMDIAAREWSAVALDATAPELAAKLLPIAPSGQPTGPISPYYVGRYGFAKDCLVLPFSGDNPCSLIGLGLVTPGQVALSLGTSDTLFACMDQPRTSKEGEGAVFASPDGAHYMALICYLNGSLAREAVRDLYGLDWDGFTAALQSTPPGNNGGLMLPYFAPEIVPKVPAPNVVRHNLDETDPRANVRAVIEAQALSSSIHARWMGVETSSLYVTGGASANAEILRVYANVHNCPVHRFETTNSGALGAALRAAHAHQSATGTSWQETVGPFTEPMTGSTIEPDPAAVATYSNMIGAYESLERTHTDN
ncbi:MAG: FGGY family carbohydrate kinase [Candidatus Latescibacterota bacterium]|nr:FGGY family carbohydrate kinase [Candidatus Latescibacterota bacterium]